MKTDAIHLHHSHRPLYIKVFSALMVLLVITVAAAYAPLGQPANLIVALTIAVIKASLIVGFFMHIRDSDRVTWMVAASAFVWMTIMIALMLADYDTRNLLSIPGK